VVTEDSRVPVLLSLENSVVEASGWQFGDSDDPPAPTKSSMVASVVDHVSVIEHSSLVMRDSTIRKLGAVGPGVSGDATADLTLENCRVFDLALYGAATRAVLRACTLSDGVMFGRSSLEGYPGMSAPTLSFEGEGNSLVFGGGSQVSVDANFAARVSGEVAIDPSFTVTQWAPGSTIIRTFPVVVEGADNRPVAGATVKVTDAETREVWRGQTGDDGRAQIEIAFDRENFDSEYRVEAEQGGTAADAPLTFLTSTPIALELRTAGTRP